MKKITVLLLFVFGIILTACHAKFIKIVTNPIPVPDNAIYLRSANNVEINGQNIILSYNSSSDSDGFTLVFFSYQDLSCDDISILINSSYGFVSEDSIFSPNDTMPQYSCNTVKTQSISEKFIFKQAGTSFLTLSAAAPLSNGFHPWADNFNIVINDTIFNVTVNSSITPNQLLTRGPQSAMNLNSSFEGCGLTGTVLQRVYDCSKKIINWGVYIDATSSASASQTTNPDGTSLYYTLFTNTNIQNSDLFWFVVSCPTGGDGSIPQQRCAWLTPIVPAGNPALDTANTQLFTLDILIGYQKRILFSGKMDNNGTGYDFANVNGFAMADAYTYATANNPGDGATGSAPTINPASVCSAVAGESLNSSTSVATFNSTDASTRDLISFDNGATVDWQVPTYPMYNILSGGTPTGSATPSCPAVAGTFGRPFCNTPTGQTSGSFTNEGFSAINVPGFAQSNTFSIPRTEMLWTSSRRSTTSWALVGFDSSGPTFSGLASSTSPGVFMGARCASSVWH